MDTKRGCVGRYEQRLAQQESGAALSKSSMYPSGRALIRTDALIENEVIHYSSGLSRSTL